MEYTTGRTQSLGSVDPHTTWDREVPGLAYPETTGYRGYGVSKHPHVCGWAALNVETPGPTGPLRGAEGLGVPREEGLDRASQGRTRGAPRGRPCDAAGTRPDVARPRARVHAPGRISGPAPGPEVLPRRPPVPGMGDAARPPSQTRETALPSLGEGKAGGRAGGTPRPPSRRRRPPGLRRC